jgi:hypothetical protein
MEKKRSFLKVDYNIFQLVGSYIVNKEKINIDYLDCLIIERILDFQNNNMKCYITNEQLAKIFNSSVRTIARKIANLIKLRIIKSEVNMYSDQGQKTRIREMVVVYPSIAICMHNRDLDKYHHTAENQGNANSDTTFPAKVMPSEVKGNANVGIKVEHIVDQNGDAQYTSADNVFNSNELKNYPFRDELRSPLGLNFDDEGDDIWK